MKNSNLFFKDIEPGLQAEIDALAIMEIPQNMIFSMPGNEINVIPIGVEGKLRVFAKDEKGRESTIYTIEEGESCVISIGGAFLHQNSPTWGIAEVPSKVKLVPAETSTKWFAMYPSWRNFVISSYNVRINDLISQHETTTQQKDKIEKQNVQIIESITYAQNIQNAVLPTKEQLNELLSEHFVFYKPKSIVSGDYYWIKKEIDKVFFVAADSTGHGVPGAMMSMLGISLLNEISNKFNGNAADFLNVMRTKVIEALNQYDINNSSKDGFDMALCIFYPQKHLVEYAGANSSFLLCRNNQLLEYKHDKMPVGIYSFGKQDFTNNQIQILQGDVIYLFSDGYRDQFGGADNQKFSYKRFKELLLQIHQLPIEEQKEELEKTFSLWKGQNEQIDDVMVLGIKIN